MEHLDLVRQRKADSSLFGQHSWGISPLFIPNAMFVSVLKKRWKSFCVK